MPKRIYLFLFVTALITLFLSMPSLTAAGDTEGGQSLEITYIEYQRGDENVLIAVEGIATGYQDNPELIFMVNEDLRQVSFEYSPCPENEENICWQTSYTSEPLFWNTRYHLYVIDPTNEVMDYGWLLLSNGHPVNCSTVCGPPPA